MRHLKVYDEYLKEEKSWFNFLKKPTKYKPIPIDENDPWGEDTHREYTFGDWFKNNRSKIKNSRFPFLIKTIDCSQSMITSLKGIEKLINLSSLTCAGNLLSDLKGIENLKHLEILWVYDNKLKSIKEVKNLKNLKEFSCSGNLLTSLEGIENLINLERLYCYLNPITCVIGIEKLKNLQQLYAFGGTMFSETYKEYLKKYCRKKNIGYII